MAGFNVSLKMSGTCPEVDGAEWNDQIEDYLDRQILKRINPVVAGPPGEPAPWWYGCTDSKHRAKNAYAYERQQAVLRDIAAKDRVLQYETGYQARKKGRYKAPYVDGATYIAFEPANFRATALRPSGTKADSDAACWDVNLGEEVVSDRISPSLRAD